MSRYLAPARIGLLALIELYTEEAVPTDAIVPVVNFLASHLLDCDLTISSPTAPPDRWAKAESAIRLVLSIRDFEQVLGPFLAADRLPGRRLWDRFLEKLWHIDSLHGLQEFIDRLPNMLAKTKEELRRRAAAGKKPPTSVLLSPTAPFGAFVKRSCLEFSRMQFNHSAELWQGFVKYRQPTAGYWRRRNPQHGRLSFDSVLVNGEEEWGRSTDALAVVAYGNMLLMGDLDETVTVSTDDIESLLEIQVEQLHRYGNRIPAGLRDQFRHILKDSHFIPSLAHYLNYSDTWRSGDYPTAFDHLHRYFDYTMQNRGRLFYQYALMNLAILQSDFGCHKEAVTTMLESVSTARENRDTTCLNFALHWLFHFGRAHPKLVRELESSSMLGTGKETLMFLQLRAKESGMWVLWSSALMAEAKLVMSNGDSVATALEHMVRSSQLNIERNMKTMMGAQLSTIATLWDRLGLAHMSTMTCEVFLRCHARNSIFDDELKMTCRLAGLLAGKGRYEEAFEKIEGINRNSLDSVKASQYWHLFRGLLKLRRDLHRGNLEAADDLLSQLLQAGPESFEPDMVFMIDSLHIEALTRRGEFQAAFNKIDRLISELREDNRDISLRIRLLLNKVHLFDRIDRPEKGFTIAMRAASMAWRARLVPLLWQAIGALANILNALGEFAAAAQLLFAILPRCLETDSIFVVATLYSLLADARMGQAGEVQGRSDAHTHERTEFLTRAHEALDAALKHYSAVEDVEKQCEMLAKKATLMRVMGDDVLAEDCAAKYLVMKRAAVGRNG
ncbi:anaphase-promoting complex subunit 5-domain-containing protein [Lasiosphaeria hispida]|uniref:Anaphase-promoting complex subunit 5 n=1 Tax=Lasiosphaeria hispida TaxID=260671 RepID=A0AAJ0HVI3_9PEZI|nr:anaphase-promoting complex subunit 5-domain-containing protein [Lasiosphaeria hispida]